MAVCRMRIATMSFKKISAAFETEQLKSHRTKKKNNSRNYCYWIVCANWNLYRQTAGPFPSSVLQFPISCIKIATEYKGAIIFSLCCMCVSVSHFRPVVFYNVSVSVYTKIFVFHSGHVYRINEFTLKCDNYSAITALLLACCNSLVNLYSNVNVDES